MLNKEKLLKIKKGTKLIVNNSLGPCNAVALESIKQGRGLKSTLFIDLKGSEIGFHDEAGSILVNQILEVRGNHD